MPAPALNSFADDAASMNVGELTIENGKDRVAVYGQLDLTRDKAGLRGAARTHPRPGAHSRA